MDSCTKSCPLTDYKFVDMKGELSNDLTVDEKYNILIKTDKPLNLVLNLVGTMPRETKPECNSIIIENSISI